VKKFKIDKENNEIICRLKCEDCKLYKYSQKMGNSYISQTIDILRNNGKITEKEIQNYNSSSACYILYQYIKKTKKKIKIWKNLKLLKIIM
jgi:hypothetical protein